MKHEVYYPLQHHVVDGKDFIIAYDKKGTVFFFDRKGDLRFDAVKLKEELIAPLQFSASGKASEMIGADSKGNVYIYIITRGFFMPFNQHSQRNTTEPQARHINSL
jgi:hypothetical protein